MQKKYDFIGDVRGQGLFIGIEFIDKEGNPSKEIASLIKEEMKKKFILLGTDRPFYNVIKIKPSICFDLDNANHFLAKLGEIVSLNDQTIVNKL